MKRAAIMLATLAACGGGGSTKSEGSGSAPAPVAADAAPPAVVIDAPPAATAPKLPARDHRVFQCAQGSGDKKLVDAFLVKHGLADASGAPNEAYKAFVEEHGVWVRANIGSLQDLADERKARRCAEAALK